MVVVTQTRWQEGANTDGYRRKVAMGGVQKGISSSFQLCLHLEMQSWKSNHIHRAEETNWTGIETGNWNGMPRLDWSVKSNSQFPEKIEFT